MTARESLQTLEDNKVFEGRQLRLGHASRVLACDMTFSVFLPRQALAAPDARFPVVYWLSGLTCTDQNFVQKAGAQRAASELGLINALITSGKERFLTHPLFELFLKLKW